MILMEQPRRFNLKGRIREGRLGTMWVGRVKPESNGLYKSDRKVWIQWTAGSPLCFRAAGDRKNVF